MKKLGGLKEKTLPSHGKSFGTSEPAKFLNLPKAGRGVQPPQSGKILTNHDHGMSVNAVLGDLSIGNNERASKVGKQLSSPNTKFDVDSSTKGLRK